jgi:dTDP-glucose 4,6-dehydratase
MTFGSLAGEDLEYCSNFLDRKGMDLAGTSILITGGTGFLGKWLTLFILWQKRQLGKQIRLYLLTRNVAAFKEQFDATFWAPNDVVFLEGSVNEPLPLDEEVDLIVHGATDVVNAVRPALTITTCLTGTDHVLEFAKTHGTSRIVLLSSGAVYATPNTWVPPHEVDELVTADMQNATAYAVGKCLAEWHMHKSLEDTSISYSIARCFAFGGPFIPLDRHFAFGSFIGKALQNQDIVINGDPRVERSYLYCADFVTWIFTILMSAPNRSVFNVGSSVVTTIGDLAEEIRQVSGSRSQILIPGNHSLETPPSRYYPNTEKAMNSLGLTQNFTLCQMIHRTLEWANPDGQ